MFLPIEIADPGLPHRTITVGCWLAPAGAKVVEGDRLLELLAGEVVVDVPAPATGRLAEKRVAEGDIVTPRQVLGVIEADDEPGCRGEPPTQ